MFMPNYGIKILLTITELWKRTVQVGVLTLPLQDV